MTFDGAMFSFVILGLQLITIVGTSTSFINYRGRENELRDGTHDIQDYSIHSRQKRVGLGGVMAMGRKALRKLLADAVEHPTGKYAYKEFTKKGSPQKAEKDFSDMNPRNTLATTYTNGMEFRKGEVGDLLVTLTKDEANGKAVIEVMRNRKYSAAKSNFKTTVTYSE